MAAKYVTMGGDERAGRRIYQHMKQAREAVPFRSSATTCVAVPRNMRG